MTEEAQLVIMLRNEKSGFLETEYAAISLAELDELEPLLVNVFAVQNGEDTHIHMKLSTECDVADWEFEAIYDYYDTEVFAGHTVSIQEIEDVANPTWELVFDAPPEEPNMSELAAKVRKLLEIHNHELVDVLQAIAGKESEYSDEQ